MPKPGYGALKLRNGDDYYHIGIVAEDGTHVYESKGTLFGFVVSDVKEWDWFGSFNDVDYSEEVKPVEKALYQARVTTDGGILRLREEPSTKSEILAKLQRNAGTASDLVSVIVEFTVKTLEDEQKNEVFVTGQTKLLGQPEYQDVGKAKALIGSLDENMISTLPVPDKDSSVKILVGPENVSQALKETSVVMARYDLGDGMQGMIGVVGPTRMDYAQVAARLSYFAEGLGKMFSKALPPSSQEENETPLQED